MKTHLKTLILLSSISFVHAQISSPKLEALRANVMGNPESVAAFWGEVRATGAPLVEEIEGTEDVLVTFLLRSESELRNAVVFASVLPENNPERQRLARLDGSDVWFRTFRFRRDVPILYELSTDGPENLKRDPLNPRFVDGSMGGSVVMPRGGIPQRGQSGNPAGGKLEDATLRSKLLANERKVATYLPAGFRLGQEYRLILVLDEDVFNSLVKLPRILDGLIAARMLQPTVVAMVGNVSRERELSCNPAFSRTLSDELVPWIKGHFKFRTRGRTTVAGSSLGGLAAACAGFQASKTFDSVVALSGSFRWRPGGDPEPEWFARQLSAAPVVPVHFFVGVGTFETGTPREAANPSLLTAARHLRDVLQARGYRFTYLEFPGAHEPLSWSLNIGDALVASQRKLKENE